MTAMALQQRLLRYAPIVFATLWSTGYIAGKMCGQYAGPFTFLSLRFAFVLVLLAPIAWWRGALFPSGRALSDALVTGALVHGVYLGGIFWAIEHGMPTGVAALIVSLQPLLTACMAWPILGERPGSATWAGLVLGLGGTLLVLAPRMGNLDGVIAARPLDADAIGVAAGALLAITLGTVWQKRAQASGADPLAAFTLQFVGALVVVVPCAIFHDAMPITWTWNFIAALAWLVVVLSVGAFGLLMFMLRHGEVSRVAANFYLIPVITALMAYPLFGETLLPVQMAGMVLVVLAVLLAG